MTAMKFVQIVGKNNTLRTIFNRETYHDAEENTTGIEEIKLLKEVTAPRKNSCATFHYLTWL